MYVPVALILNILTSTIPSKNVDLPVFQLWQSWQLKSTKPKFKQTKSFEKLIQNYLFTIMECMISSSLTRTNMSTIHGKRDNRRAGMCHFARSRGEYFSQSATHFPCSCPVLKRTMILYLNKMVEPKRKFVPSSQISQGQSHHSFDSTARPDRTGVYMLLSIHETRKFMYFPKRLRSM